MTDSSPVVSFLGVGVSSLAGVLVSYRLPGTFAWTWLTRDGGLAAQGQAAQVDVGAADPVVVEPLLDGSVAIRFAGVWSAAVGHLAATATPPPPWLASRSGTSLRFTRGNRGYAVLPPSGEQLPDCTQVVELRSRSGQLCGRVAIREGAGPCTGGSLEQGWDGTLIRARLGDACSAATCACSVEVWPRLLAGE